MLTLSDVARIADSLRSGSLAVLPTETGYMLAALANSMPAIERAFAVKQRDPAQVMHVACASVAMAASVGKLTPAALRLLGAFTPGPLSVIVAKTAALPDRLVTVNGTVGIRVPDHPGTLNWPVGETVYVVEDDEAISYGTGSTLVRLTGADDVEILRPGPVSESDIDEAMCVTS